MTNKTASPETVADIEDIHRGLHAAMDAALKNHKPAELKIILHQLDERLVSLINTLKGANPGSWY